jgi:hypothetical protein
MDRVPVIGGHMWKSLRRLPHPCISIFHIAFVMMAIRVHVSGEEIYGRAKGQFFKSAPLSTFLPVSWRGRFKGKNMIG